MMYEQTNLFEHMMAETMPEVRFVDATPSFSESVEKSKRICTVEGCGNKHVANGWCRKHYLRMYKHRRLDLPRMHGMTKTRPYRIWRGMINRCYNTRMAGFAAYGATGITVCDRWKNDFKKFWEDMSETYFDGATIDRIDNDKGYSPENCRWATQLQQARNKRKTQRFQYEGKELTTGEIAEISGIAYPTVFARLHRYGWSVEKCIKTPSLRNHAAA